MGISPLNDQADVSTLDITGYDLVAYGASPTKGMDMDTSMKYGTQHVMRTGYLTQGQERNPWVQQSQYGIPDYSPRPYSDGVYDFIVIHLMSGLDRKTGAAGDGQ
jgi:hypothetical protein